MYFSLIHERLCPPVKIHSHSFYALYPDLAVIWHQKKTERFWHKTGTFLRDVSVRIPDTANRNHAVWRNNESGGQFHNQHSVCFANCISFTYLYPRIPQALLAVLPPISSLEIYFQTVIAPFIWQNSQNQRANESI